MPARYKGKKSVQIITELFLAQCGMPETFGRMLVTLSHDIECKVRLQFKLLLLLNDQAFNELSQFEGQQTFEHPTMTYNDAIDRRVWITCREFFLNHTTCHVNVSKTP